MSRIEKSSASIINVCFKLNPRAYYLSKSEEKMSFTGAVCLDLSKLPFNVSDKGAFLTVWLVNKDEGTCLERRGRVDEDESITV